MRKGKMIAQGAHASITILKTFGSVFSKKFSEWFESGQTKIVVGVNSEEELLSIYIEARQYMPASLITDKGLTEFNNIPTKTAVAIGPWESEEIDNLTGHLKLL